MPNENPSCSVITIAQHNENFSYRDKTNKSYRAIFYCPQGLHSRWRKHFILSGISQHLEGLIERHEKWSGRYMRIRQKRILKYTSKSVA